MKIKLKKVRNWVRKKLVESNIDLINYNYPEKIKGFNMVKKCFNEDGLRPYESYQLYAIVNRLCEKRKGNLAEVGVYKGYSAKMICETKGSNSLYLFDTFSGLPKPTEIDSPYEEGDYSSTEEEVKQCLNKYENVEITKGIFPFSATERIKSLKFIFVHIDTDLYDSILNSLNFFYPRMEQGGIMMIHDALTDGGKEAIKDFFQDKPEIPIELNGLHVMIVRQ